MDEHFDYEIIARCTYPVPSMGTPELYADCGEAAIYHVWFWDDEGNDAGDMNVCAEHFDKISQSVVANDSPEK